MDILYNFVERLKALASPLPQGIYTAKSFWDPNGQNDPYWTQYYLWLCDIAGEVPVPLPWTKWTFWQYTFKLHGPTYGAESLDLDGDRYNGTLEQMKAEFHLPDIGLEIPEPPPPVVNEVKYRVLRNMNIRAGASTAYADIGDLKAGDIVIAKDFGGNNLWIKIGEGEWAAVQYNGTRYMERI